LALIISSRFDSKNVTLLRRGEGGALNLETLPLP